MFLYPLYALFIYRNFRWHNLTPYIAWGLLVFLLFTIPFKTYQDKFLIIQKTIKIYQDMKNKENGVLYIPQIINPQTFCQNSVQRTFGGDKATNMVFRIFIWQDMISEMIKDKAWFGEGLSHPLRSEQLEKLKWAKEEWGRDGWISAHNSYLYVIYRIGIFGILALGWLFFALYGCFKALLLKKDVSGLILFFCLSFWLFKACWSEQFQIPYNAIPMWVVCGLIFQRSKNASTLKRQNIS